MMTDNKVEPHTFRSGVASSAEVRRNDQTINEGIHQKCGVVKSETIQRHRPTKKKEHDVHKRPSIRFDGVAVDELLFEVECPRSPSMFL